MLVVCAVVLSLLLAALTISFAANAERIRSGFEGERSRRLAAEAELKVQQTQDSLETANLQKQVEALNTRVSELTRENSTLQQERTTLRADVERANAEKESVRARIDQLAATNETQAAVIKSYRDEVQGLRDAFAAGAKREVDLVDRINDLESAREVLEQTARALQEQLTEARTQLQTAQQGVSATTARAGSPIENLGPLVRARVTSTFRDDAGRDMVIISEGSNRGVRENTFMNVVRGGTQYVAKLVVTRVEPGQSVCRVDLLAPGMTSIAVGDDVLSRLQ
jgi:regulator of replication initiation timing